MGTTNDVANAFYINCKGLLTTSETAVYWAIVTIWNAHCRQPWLSISRQEIMSYSGVTCTKTIDKARKGLEKKGLIKSISTGRTQARKFSICELPTKGINPLVKNTKGVNPLAKGINPLALGESFPQTKGINPHITETENNTEITEYKSPSKVVPTFKVHTPPEREIPPLPDDLLNYYFRFNPTPKLTEKEKLAIWAEQYTVEKVKDAIDVAIENEAHHIKYIGRVLENNKGGAIKHDNMGGNTSQGESADEWADRLAAEYHL
jgi:hypothetical protein